MGKRGRPPHPDILTPREWEVLELLREGLSNPDIAERMGIGREGVKYHVSEILSKLGVASRDEAARWSAPPAEERRPWRSAAFAPLAMLLRRAGAALPGQLSSAALALSAAAIVAVLAVLGLIALLLLRGGDGDHRPATEMVSVNSAGEPANGSSSEFAISADGRYVAFESVATNLAREGLEPVGPSHVTRVFVHDRETGITEGMNINENGELASWKSSSPAVSADGRYVAFCLGADNVVPVDTNGIGGVFVRDRKTASTEIVSVSSTGAQADDRSCGPSISADGRYVAFNSYATNLVLGDTNEADDIFVHDRETGITERVSVDSDGNEAVGFGDWRPLFGDPALSADGRFVAFSASASDLVHGDTNDAVDVFVHDRERSVTERVSVGMDGGQLDTWSSSPAISADGRFVAFDRSCSIASASEVIFAGSGAGDAREEEVEEDCPDVYVRDRLAGTTDRTDLITPQRFRKVPRISEPQISADGRYVAVTMSTDSLVVYIHDREAGEADSVLTINSRDTPVLHNQMAISSDGRYIAFRSGHQGLVPADAGELWQIYVHDLAQQAADLRSPTGP